MENFNIHDWQDKFLFKEQEDEKSDPETKTMSGLANDFLDVSKKLRKGEYKGLQSAEISEINKLVDMVLQAAMETNITTVIQRLETMIGKSIKGTVDLPGEESPGDESDIGDEII